MIEHGAVVVHKASKLPTIPTPDYRQRRCVQLAERHMPGGLAHTAIADIGCNLGQLCYYLKRNYPAAEVHGVDEYETSEHDTHFHYTGWNLARSFPYPDASMDVVFALEVIEHIIDTDHFLDECWRIAKPGGLLVVSTPNINYLGNRVAVPLGYYPYWVEYRIENYHVRYYNKATLARHMSDMGFEPPEIVGSHMLPVRLVERFTAVSSISDGLSRWLGVFAPNLIALACKPMSGERQVRVLRRGVDAPVLDRPTA